MRISDSERGSACQHGRPQSVRARKAGQIRFLEAFAATGTVTGAARKTKINRQTHKKWLDTDPEYASRFSDAKEELADDLETELRQRALEGWDEPVFHKGESVGFVRRRSDTCLVHLLNATRTESLRDRQEKSSSYPGLDDEHLKSMTDGQLEEVAEALGTVRRLVEGQR